MTATVVGPGGSVQIDGPVEIENESGDPILVTVTNPGGGVGAQVEVTNFPADFPDTTAQTILQNILTAIGPLLEEGGTVNLSAGSLAALESIQATISNFPADFPDASALTALQAVLTALQGTLSVDGSVSVDNFPADFPDASALVVLSSILAELQQKIEEGGTVELSAASLAALESVTVAGTVTVVQGAPGATPWPVDISGATVDIGNLQQLSVVLPINDQNEDLQASAYAGVGPIANDALLSKLTMRFSSDAARDITVSLSDGTVLWQSLGNTNLSVDLDWGSDDGAVDAGTSVLVDITQTASPCSVDVVLTVLVGTSALGGNPILGPSDSHIGEVGIDVVGSGAGDAFGRLRISDPVALFDSQFQYDEASLHWAPIVANGGAIAHQPSMSAVQISTTTTTGSRVRFQTRQHVRYQPGKSQLTVASFLFGSAVAGVRRRVGYFSDSNGIFLEQNGTTDVAFVRRTSTSGSPVDNRITQDNWNIDPMDGTGPSGVTLDLSKVQLVIIDLQWLAVGRVRVGFDVGGRVTYVHEFAHANVLTLPYMTTANLPVRYEQENLGGGISTTMLAICATVISEGGRQPFGLPRSANTGVTSRNVGTTAEPILAIRPKATFGGLTNRGLIYPLHIDLQASSDMLWSVVHRPTLTAPSWGSVGAQSIAERDISATALSGGTVVASGYKGTGNEAINADLLLERIILSLHPDGITQDDILALVVQSVSGTVNVRGALAWREEW